MCLAGTDDDGVAADTDQVGVEAVDDYTVKFSFKRAEGSGYYFKRILKLPLCSSGTYFRYWELCGYQ